MIHDLLFRVRVLVRRNAMEAGLDEELRAHLEHQAEKLMRRGLSREEAERRARFDFGDLDQVKNECRRSWGVQFIDDLAAEVCAGLRLARRKPAFSTVSVLALGLGLLANTMVFDGVTSVVERFSSRHDPASPVLAARHSVPPPPPVIKNETHPGLAVQKLHGGKLSHAKRRENDPARLASAAYGRVTIITAACFLAPSVGRASAARWIVRNAEITGNRFVLISSSWEQPRPGAEVEALEMTIQSGHASYTFVEVISGNPENPQQEGSRPVVLNARAAMSNTAQRGAAAVAQQSGQCPSINKHLSNL